MFHFIFFFYFAPSPKQILGGIGDQVNCGGGERGMGVKVQVSDSAADTSDWLVMQLTPS